VTALDYDVDEAKRETFGRSVQEYLPALRPETLQPDMSGIRPKLQGPGEPARDFVVREETQAGFPGLVNLIGIESPGLTSSIALARHVADGCRRDDAAMTLSNSLIVSRRHGMLLMRRLNLGGAWPGFPPAGLLFGAFPLSPRKGVLATATSASNLNLLAHWN
jgi:hypothetical protein